MALRVMLQRTVILQPTYKMALKWSMILKIHDKNINLFSICDLHF